MRAAVSALGTLTLVAAIATGCDDTTGAPDALPTNIDLSREWPVVAPEDQGIDPSLLQVAFNVARSQPHLKSLLVIRNGYLVAEEYFSGDADTAVTDVRAVTTSFCLWLASPSGGEISRESTSPSAISSCLTWCHRSTRHIAASRSGTCSR